MIEPDLYPHQREAAAKLSKGKILKGGVGSGKTRAAMAYFSRLAPWIRLIVITTAKKRDSGDWEAEAKLWGTEVTVDSWNNLYLYEDTEDAFFIFDEQRVVGSGVWVHAFLQISKKNDWILLSATPGDTWLDYIPVFIANGYYKSRREFLMEHVQFHPYTKYPKVQKYLGTERLDRQLREITVDMPFERHTTRHEVDVYVEYDRDLFENVWRRRWNHLEMRPIRHISEMFNLARRVTNTDPSRLLAVKDLLIAHPKMIIFYNFDYELEILRSLKEGTWIWVADEEHERTLESFAVAEWNGHKHEPIPDTDSWVYLVHYASGSEGWNCTETDVVLFYSLTYSYKQFEQAKGRIDRVNTLFDDLYYYILRCSSPVDGAVYKSLAEKKDFSEARFMRGMS